MTGHGLRPKHCGSCTLCCQLVPVPQLQLRAFSTCQHVRLPPQATLGCAIYAARPHPCRVWSCQWLTSEDWPDEYRPDRCGIVVDPVPDLITIEGTDMPACQFWVRRDAENAFGDPDNIVVRTLIFSAFEEGQAVLWRIAGDQPGEQKAAVLWRDKDGRLCIWGPRKSDAEPSIPEYHDRARRAYAMLGRAS